MQLHLYECRLVAIYAGLFTEKFCLTFVTSANNEYLNSFYRFVINKHDNYRFYYFKQHSAVQCTYRDEKSFHDFKTLLFL